GESAACHRRVFTLLDVLAFGRSRGIAELHRAVVDAEVCKLKAIGVSLASVVVGMHLKIGAANSSDGVGSVHFECRRTATHRADDYRVQTTAQQSDLARRADSVHQDAVVN